MHIGHADLRRGPHGQINKLQPPPPILLHVLPSPFAARVLSRCLPRASSRAVYRFFPRATCSAFLPSRNLLCARCHASSSARSASALVHLALHVLSWSCCDKVNDCAGRTLHSALQEQTNKQTNKQTKQTNKKTNKQTNKQNQQATRHAGTPQAHKHTSTQAHKHTGRQAQRQSQRHTDTRYISHM